MDELLTLKELENRTLKEIYQYARELKIPYYSQMNKKELAIAVIRAQEEKQGFFITDGVLDIVEQQEFGFLRPINYTPSQEDIYISASQIRRFGLRNGDKITGKARPPKPSERYYGLMHVNRVNNKDPEDAKERSHFPALTPLYPEKQMILENKIAIENFSVFPDLIMMDGGKGQVNIAKKVLENLKLDIPVCGLVKDDFHRTRGIMYENKEIILASNSSGFRFVSLARGQ